MRRIPLESCWLERESESFSLSLTCVPWPKERSGLTFATPSSLVFTIHRHKDIDFDGKHPKLAEVLMNDVKLVRYQMNPEANWGPQSRAVSGTGAGKQ